MVSYWIGREDYVEVIDKANGSVKGRVANVDDNGLVVDQEDSSRSFFFPWGGIVRVEYLG